MIATGRNVLAAVLWMVAASLARSAAAATKFASEEVAVASKDPLMAEAVAARMKLGDAFAKQDVAEVADPVRQG